MVKCKDCIHNEVCLYIWKFSFEGTDSRKELREDADFGVDRSCGHFMTLGNLKRKKKKKNEMV